MNYVGVSAVTDLRNRVFEKVIRQGSQFFEANSTGKLMSSIMNDIEKIQVATSHILADLLRQVFVVVGLLFVLLHNDWKLGLVSLTVLPFVLAPTARLGRRIRRTTRRAQDVPAELNQILQETLSGHQVVKAFGTEAYEVGRFRAAARRLRKSNLRYVLQQALASPLIELFGAITIVGLLTYARVQIVAGQMTCGRVHQLRDRAAHALRAGQAAHRHPQHLRAGHRRIAESIRGARSRRGNPREAGRQTARAIPRFHRVRRRELPLSVRHQLCAALGPPWR